MKTERLANTYLKRQKEYYEKAHKIIELRVESLLSDIALGENITRTQLWNMVKWVSLKQEIEKNFKIVGRTQIDDINELSRIIYEEVVGLTLKDFVDSGVAYNTVSPKQVSQLLNAAFESVEYSERVWAGAMVRGRIEANYMKLSSRVQKDLEDMIILGKSPTEIKSMLAHDFDVSYNVADRLFRTEANYVYNMASKDTYRELGVKQVKYLHKGVCSDKCDCHSLDGKIFTLGTEPTLPRHPNCVCCYAPVVQLTK